MGEVTNRELELLYGAGNLGRWAFHREETRRSSRRRNADCGHEVDALEPYRYSVGKVAGAAGIVQTYGCDHCYSGERRT